MDFCEKRRVVGLGWPKIDPEVIKKEDWGVLKTALRKNYPDYCSSSGAAGRSAGQLWSFYHECSVGDYMLYYDPPRKHVRICRVVSDPMYRDFETNDETDIWHYRKVEYPIDPIPILDFYGALKGSLLGPRMSFWDISWGYETIEGLANKVSPEEIAAAEPELEAAYQNLQKIVMDRCMVLNEKDWETLVAEYFRAQGAEVGKVGGNQPVIDAEARFDRGELGFDIWRVQVKRRQDSKVDWPEIEDILEKIGDANLCFVSVFGFTEEARERVESEGEPGSRQIRLLEKEDFFRFIITGRMDEKLKRRIKVPF